MSSHNRSTSIIGVLGTGEFAAALTNRLLCSGYDVIIGSRRPEGRNLLVDHCYCNFNITSIDDCVQKSNIIIVAIHPESYKDTLYAYRNKLSSKIVVDVSNRQSPSRGEESHAEYLATILPSAHVVKAFNVIPSSVMNQNSLDGQTRVFVAGNDVEAKDKVSNLAVNMGFSPKDCGPLKSARSVEEFNRRAFPAWRGATITTVGVFNLWLVYVLIMIFSENRTEKFNQLFLKVVNKPICLTAVTLMALIHLPGPLASLARLYSGKTRKAPKWFERWNNAKTQFSVFCFILVALHVLISILITNKTYFPALYEAEALKTPCNKTHSELSAVSDWMNWKGEAGLLLGFLALVALSVVGITALPGIRLSLNWKEKHLSQSTMSYIAIFLALCHVTLLAIADWTSNGGWPFYHTTSFLGIILPTVALLLVLSVAMPCVRNISKKRKANVQFYNINKKCSCGDNSKDSLMEAKDCGITIFQDRARLSDRVGYTTLVEEGE